MASQSTATNKPGAHEVFKAFLAVGATSFGGGVVGHIRNSVVVKRAWMDDSTFVELLTISQSLPGLNAANMALLAGDRLAGTRGAIAALAGICLPGALLMYLVGVLYEAERQRPLVTAALAGIAPAAAGLLLATTFKLGRASVAKLDDLLFVALTVIGINRLHWPVPRALIGVGLLAILWHALVRRLKGLSG
jgi:chromate transporter